MQIWSKGSSGKQMKNKDAAHTLTSNHRLIDKVVYKYLIPSIVAMLCTRMGALFSGIIAGSFFGGFGLKVLSLASPVALIYLSFGALIGVGGALSSSIALGENDKEKVSLYYTLSWILTLSVGLVLSVLIIFNRGQVATLLGGKGDLFQPLKSYIFVYALGGVFPVALYVPLNFLKVIGKPKHSMMMLIIMSLSSILFSLLLIFYVGPYVWTISAGLILGTLLALAFGMYHLKNSFLRWKKPKEIRKYKNMLRMGGPSALNNICRAIQLFFLNWLLLRCEGGIFLSVYSVLNIQVDFIFSLILGFSQMLLPILSIAYGEKDLRSIQRVFKKILLLGNLLIGAWAVFVFLIRTKLATLFGFEDMVLILELKEAFLFFSFSINFMFINHMIISYFNATKKFLIANGLIVLKTVVFMLLFSGILSMYFGVRGIWASFFLTELLTLTVAFLYVKIKQLKENRLIPYWLLSRDAFDDKASIEFSVEDDKEKIAQASFQIAEFCEDFQLSSKRVLYISLTIEEVLMLFHQQKKTFKGSDSSDVRMVITQEEIVFRIRNGGKGFNPVAYYYEKVGQENVSAPLDIDGTAFAGEEDEVGQIIGIQMILKMAKDVEYTDTYGVNNLMITMERGV